MRHNILRGAFLGAALVFTTTSCDLFRPASDTKPAKKTKKDTEITPQPPQGNAGTVLVDTVRWRSDQAAKPPITSSMPTADGKPTTPTNNGGTGVVNTKKSGYTMTVLLPFFTDKFVEGATTNYAKSQFALDFYAGVRVAIDSLSSSPMNLTVNVLDSRGDFNAVLARPEVAKADLLLGPVDKETVPSAIDFSTRNGVVFVSPYFPTGDVEGANPYFVQVKPSLQTHCDNLMRHIRSRYKTEQVVLAGRVKDNETLRFRLFQEANSEINKKQYGGRLDEWAIDDETNMNIDAYINDEVTTVFVVPSWNEAFVGAFLKKLASSPKKANAVVYGMPQWMDFDRSINTTMSSLTVRVSSSTFIDGNSPGVRDFRQRFLNKYNKMPTADAFLGFDCTMYFARMMAKNGAKFTYSLEGASLPVLHTKFQFSPQYRAAGDNNLNNVAKYENKFVNILRFQNGSFRLDN